MRNASERKDIRRLEKLSAENERARIEFVVAAMGTKQGRSWFLNLLSLCSIFDGTFTGDALLESFTKGQRNIGLMVYNDIVTHCPDDFVRMMKESAIQELTNDRRSEPNPDDSDDSAADGEYTGGEDGNG
jgi:hypothetical protein